MVDVTREEGTEHSHPVSEGRERERGGEGEGLVRGFLVKS